MVDYPPDPIGRTSGDQFYHHGHGELRVDRVIE